MPIVALLSESTSDAQTKVFSRWRRHHRLLRKLKLDNLWRGCLGLAFVLRGRNHCQWPEYAPHLFVPDSDVLWASIQDIPRGRFAAGLLRGGQLATIRRTTVRFGMPVLGPSGIVQQWDLRLAHHPRGSCRLIGDDDVGLPVLEQCSSVFNALNWAMSAIAFSLRPRWKVKQGDFIRKAGKGNNIDRFHRANFGRSEECCFPRPYIGFKEAAAHLLWDSATRL